MTTNDPVYAADRFASHDLPNDSIGYVLQRVVEIEGILQSQPAVLANADVAFRRAEHEYKRVQASKQLEAAGDSGLKTQAQRDAWVFGQVADARWDREVAAVALEYAKSGVFSVRAEADLLRSRLAGMRTEFQGVGR